MSIDEGKALLAEGYVYLDVRSEPEFEAGHPPGALNVPLLHAGAGGMTPNPDFSRVVEAAFGRGERLIVGCRSGSRSLKAARLMVQAGFTEVVDLRPGWDGARDAFGRLEPGWSRCELPIETGKAPGQRYEDVKSRKPVA